MTRLHSLWTTNKDGVYAYGARIGYWPCVGGPFVQVTFGKKHLSIWIGIEYDDTEYDDKGQAE